VARPEILEVLEELIFRGVVLFFQENKIKTSSEGWCKML